MKTLVFLAAIMIGNMGLAATSDNLTLYKCFSSQDTSGNTIVDLNSPLLLLNLDQKQNRYKISLNGNDSVTDRTFTNEKGEVTYENFKNQLTLQIRIERAMVIDLKTRNLFVMFASSYSSNGAVTPVVCQGQIP